MRQRSENNRQRNRWLLLAVTIGIAPMLVAVVILAVYIREPSPAPLEPRLGKLVHDLQAEIPFHYSLVNKMPPALKAALVPNRLVRLARNEANRVAGPRDQARRELGRMGTNAWPAIPLLLKTLLRQDLPTRYAAAKVLAHIKADQAPEFERLKPGLSNRARPADVFGLLLTGNDESGLRNGREIRCFALAGLAALGPGARSRLGMVIEVAKSKDEDHEMRAMALEVIRSVGSLGKGTEFFLKQLFQDREEWPDVRAAAIRALTDAAPGDPQLRSLLRQALGDSPGLVRIAAAEALWQLGSPAAEVLPVMADALGHKLASVRLAALKAVTRMGKAAQPIASAVRALLSDEKEPVRQAATAALASMGCEQDQNTQGSGKETNDPGRKPRDLPEAPATPSVSAVGDGSRPCHPATLPPTKPQDASPQS